MAPMILGYWDCRGLAQPIRYLLEHVGEKYEYKGYAFNDTAWVDEKHSLGFQFPNIPYLIDGDVRLTQSQAILRYLGKKYGLVAKNDEDQRTQDMLDGYLWDLIIGTGMFFYPHIRPKTFPDNFEEGKKQFVAETLQPKMKELEQFLTGKKFLLGDQLHYNDFLLFERLDEQNAAFPEAMEQFPNLKKYHQNMLNQKGVKDFLESDRSPKWFRAPQAEWGGPADIHMVFDQKTRSYVKQ